MQRGATRSDVNTVVRRFEAGPEAAAQALGWKWTGREGHGRCPACAEGEDRGWVRAHRDGGGRITVNCRVCTDPDDLRAALDRILGPEPPDPTRLRTAVLDGRKRKPRVLPKPARDKPPTAAPRAPDARVERARRLWAASEAPEGTPARHYLVERRAWPPEGPDLPRLPPSVRWIPARRWPQNAVMLALPDGAAGVIAFAFDSPGGGLRAVSVDALDQDGARLVPRWRRTIGTKAGARFAALDGEGGTAVIVEGEVDALAESLARRNDRDVRAVLAAGGTPLLASLARCEAGTRERLVLVMDDDEAGQHAAIRAALAVHRAGLGLPTRHAYSGGDAADALVHEIREREAIRDPEGQNPDRVLRAVWTDFLRTEAYQHG